MDDSCNVEVRRGVKGDSFIALAMAGSYNAAALRVGHGHAREGETDLCDSVRIALELFSEFERQEDKRRFLGRKSPSECQQRRIG